MNFRRNMIGRLKYRERASRYSLEVMYPISTKMIPRLFLFPPPAIPSAFLAPPPIVQPWSRPGLPRSYLLGSLKSFAAISFLLPNGFARAGISSWGIWATVSCPNKKSEAEGRFQFFSTYPRPTSYLMTSVFRGFPFSSCSSRNGFVWRGFQKLCQQVLGPVSLSRGRWFLWIVWIFQHAKFTDVNH